MRGAVVLGMWRDCKDGDLSPLRTVTPEHPIGPGRVVLHVGLEDLLPLVVGVRQRVVFVGLQA